MEIKRVYVVADGGTSDLEDKVWTLSTDQFKPGWETDSGYNGYGLPREVAEFYAACVNYCIDHCYIMLPVEGGGFLIKHRLEIEGGNYGD